MYIDTHCHLSVEDYDDIDQVLLDNKASGVSKMILSGCTKDSIQETLNFLDKYDFLYATIGFHPSEALITTDDDICLLEKQLLHDKVVGIGEIGLDYHYGKEDIEEQKGLFRKQMELAKKYHLPVVIHSRDATEDTMNILKEYPEVKGDIHCFSGSVEIAKEYVKMSYMIGIGGVITFKNSQLYKVVEAIGINHILLETDAPYLTPEPFRGHKNSSKYIPYVSKRVGEILNMEDKEVATSTTKNAVCMFDLK